MSKRRKGSNRVRNATIVAFSIVILIILAASLRSQQTTPVSASDYFDIYDAQYIGYLGERGQALYMTELRFEIKAVKGDAHDVFVQSINSAAEEGMVGTGTILKGQSETAYINYAYEVTVPIEDDGQFYVPVTVSSAEAVGQIFVLVAV